MPVAQLRDTRCSWLVALLGLVCCIMHLHCACLLQASTYEAAGCAKFFLAAICTALARAGAAWSGVRAGRNRHSDSSCHTLIISSGMLVTCECLAHLLRLLSAPPSRTGPCPELTCLCAAVARVSSTLFASSDWGVKCGTSCLDTMLSQKTVSTA